MQEAKSSAIKKARLSPGFLYLTCRFFAALLRNLPATGFLARPSSLLLRLCEPQSHHRTLLHDLAVADDRLEAPLAYRAFGGVVEDFRRA